MNQCYRRVLLCVFCLMTVISGLADEIQTYASPLYGYEITYPKNWHVNESESQLEISSAESFYSAQTSGAGVIITVQQLEIEDEGNAEKAFQRLSGEWGGGFKFQASSQKTFAGRDCYIVEFTDSERDMQGRIYSIVKGLYVYMIATGYKLADARQEFGKTISAMLSSFKFLPVDYTEHHDETIGLSFKYPTNTKFDSSYNQFMILLAGEEFSTSNNGAGILMGIVEDESLIATKNEQEFFQKITEMENNAAITTGPKPFKLLGTTWHMAEISFEGGKLSVLAHREYDLIFLIAYAVKPVFASPEYDESFFIFLDSLQVDLKKWADRIKGINQ